MIRSSAWLGRFRETSKKNLQKSQNSSCIRVTIGYIEHMTNELTNKLSKMSIEEVADIAARMNADSRDEAGIVLEAALEVLEAKMSEADFVRFCDKLAA
jgi:hypothetical protein